MSDAEAPGDGLEMVDVEVPLPAVTVERIAAEVARKQAETGADVDREQFIRYAVNDLLERAEGQRRHR